MIDDIKNELNAMAEADYRDFSKKLIPEASLPLLGVRLPALRAAAAEIVKRGRGDEFLRECDFSSMEMCFLYAYVLGKTRADINALINTLIMQLIMSITGRPAIYCASPLNNADGIPSRFGIGSRIILTRAGPIICV